MIQVTWRHVPGLPEYLRANGHDVEFRDGQAYATEGAQALIDAYDPLPTLKAEKLVALAGVYAAKIAAGYTHSDGHTYQLGPNKAGTTGIQDLGDIAAMVNNGTWPTDGSGFIRDAMNVNVPKTGPGALDVAKGASVYVLGLRSHYWSLQDQINQAVDQTALDAVDINGGW